MSNSTIHLTDKLHEYLLDVSLREDRLLKNLREETARLTMARMQIAPEQGQFMNLLVSVSGAARAVEIGTFTGYSSICIARALGEDGHLVCIDHNTDYTSIAEKYWQQAGLTDRIELLPGDASEMLKDLKKKDTGSFDFAFIDADKENYELYYESCLELLNTGGLIVIDNVLWGGRVLETDSPEADTLAIQAFNDKLKNDSRVQLSMIPVGDGLTLARKL